MQSNAYFKDSFSHVYLGMSWELCASFEFQFDCERPTCDGLHKQNGVCKESTFSAPFLPLPMMKCWAVVSQG